MKELRGLTSLRGIAALYVVVYHFSNTIAHTQNLNFKALVPRGHIAVDLFFVLSGFVMAYTYAADFRQHGISGRSKSITVTIKTLSGNRNSMASGSRIGPRSAILG